MHNCSIIGTWSIKDHFRIAISKWCKRLVRSTDISENASHWVQRLNYLAIGHMLSEAEEVYEAMRGNRLWKYVTDGWNILDWSVHIIVIAYAYLRAAGIQNKSASECQFAVRILSLNCILLWFRLVNVMTISPQLGPLVHMIALMGKDVAIFLVLLFMCTC